MKIAVLGLWHLGLITAACVAKAGFDVVAYDNNLETIANLKKSKSPIFEPGLDDLLVRDNLKFSADLNEISAANIVWVTYDTPVDDNDIGDVGFVVEEIKKVLPYLAHETLILISSQLPVGTSRQLQQYADHHYPEKKISFAYSPENLRLGKAIEIFTKPDRIVVGIQNERDQQKLQLLLSKFSDNIIWMSLESSEMTKHALNAFLATSVVFINELASLC